MPNPDLDALERRGITCRRQPVDEVNRGRAARRTTRDLKTADNVRDGDRPAEREAELILFQRRSFAAVIEKVPRIKRLVSQEFEGTAVQLIGT